MTQAISTRKTDMEALAPYLLPLSAKIHAALQGRDEIRIGKNCVYHMETDDLLLWRYNLGRTGPNQREILVIEHYRERELIKGGDWFVLRRVSDIAALPQTGEIVIHKETVTPDQLRQRMAGLYLQFRCRPAM